MKKKGFTLVELLAVVIIVGVVSFLVMPKIIERFERKKGELSSEALEMLFLATENFISSNPDLISIEEGDVCVSIQELINSGNLVSPVVDVKTNTTIPVTTKIEVISKNNQYSFVYNSSKCQ